MKKLFSVFLAVMLALSLMISVSAENEGIQAIEAILFNQDNRCIESFAAPLGAVLCKFNGPMKALNDCTANAYYACTVHGDACGLNGCQFFGAKSHSFVKRDTSAYADPQWNNKLVWVMKCSVPGCQVIGYQCYYCGAMVDRTVTPFKCKCPTIYSRPTFISITQIKKIDNCNYLYSLAFTVYEANGNCKTLKIEVTANNPNIDTTIKLDNGQKLRVKITGNGTKVSIFEFSL